MLQLLSYFDYKKLDRKQKLLVLVFILGVMFLLFSPIKQHKKAKVGQIIVETNGKGWVALKGVTLSDIAAFNFNQNGSFGLVVSSTGEVIATNNGGSNWFLAEKLPSSGDTVSSLAIDGNQVLVATMMEDSSFASLYRLSGNKWSVKTGDYAGITGLSGDAKWAVGGAGFIYQISSDGNFTASRLPSWAENTTLYSISAKENNLLVVGDYGLAVSSIDNGQSWSFVDVGVKTEKPLYACLLGQGITAIGGIGTFYCSTNVAGIANTLASDWYQVKGLTNKAAIFSFYQDKESQEMFAVGGGLDGGNAFILSSQDGVNWHQETVNSQYGRVVGVAKSHVGMLAATQFGQILIRQDIDVSVSPSNANNSTKSNIKINQ